MSDHIGANLARAIGATVSEMADQREWTIDRLADLAGIHRNQLHRMIDGGDAINTDHIAKLAVALEVAPSRLLGTISSDVAAEAVEVDFEALVYTAHREGWAMQRTA